MQHVRRVEPDRRRIVRKRRMGAIGQEPIGHPAALGVEFHARHDQPSAAQFRRFGFVQLFRGDDLQADAVGVVMDQDKGFPVHDQVTGNVALKAPEVRPPRRVRPVRPGFESAAGGAAGRGVVGARRRADASPHQRGGPVVHAVHQPRIVGGEVTGAGPRKRRPRRHFRVDRPESPKAPAPTPARRRVDHPTGGGFSGPKQFRQARKAEGHDYSASRTDRTGRIKSDTGRDTAA